MRQVPIQSQSDCIQASDSIMAELPCDLVPKFKVPFLVTVSDHSKFTIVEPLKSRAMSLIPDAHHNLMWLNAFPLRGGVSLSIPSRSLISGVPLEFKQHFQLVFGSHGAAQPSSFLPSLTGKSYKTAALFLLKSEPHHASLSHVTMTQSSSKTGCPKFGNGSSTSILRELTQLDLHDTFEHLHQLNLLPVKLRSAPGSHLFHCDAYVKAPLLAELNVTAPIPTPVLESTMLTAAIDAAEGQQVVIVDLPNAFVQANLPQSLSKWTKHLNHRYLFVSDNIMKGYRSIEYSPTTEMMAIPFTKPLLAKPFVKFRMAIMHLPDQ